MRAINQKSNQCSDASTTLTAAAAAAAAAATGGGRSGGGGRRLAVFPACPPARGVFHEGRAGPLAASREIARHSSQFGRAAAVRRRLQSRAAAIANRARRTNARQNSELAAGSERKPGGIG